MKKNNLNIKYKDDFIAIVEMQREPINAFSVSFLDSLKNAFIKLNNNKDIRVIILKSLLPHFSAGADLKERSIMTKGEAANALDSFKTCFDAIQNSEKITICCINGYCLGGGAEMSLCFDFRIGSTDSIVGFPEVSIGIIPGAGGTQRLQRVIGYSNSKYWIYTARKFNANECFQYGFFTNLVKKEELLNEALILSNQIIKNSPIGVKCAKKAIDFGADSNLNEGLLYEREEYNVAVNTDDRVEALKAFKHKREAKWSNK